MNAALIIVSVAVVVAFAVMLLRGGHPENGCDHGEHALDTTSERFYSTADRPAGPDAESPSLEREPAPPRPSERVGRTYV